MNLTIRNSIYNTICSYFFTPLVLQPARATGKSKTLIENNLFNSFEFSTLSCNIMHSISDNLIQFVILEDLITPKPNPKANVYKKTLISLIAIN